MRIGRLIVLTLLQAGVLAAQAAHGADYVVVIQDQPAGYLNVQTAADGWS